MVSMAEYLSDKVPDLCLHFRSAMFCTIRSAKRFCKIYFHRLVKTFRILILNMLLAFNTRTVLSFNCQMASVK